MKPELRKYSVATAKISAIGAFISYLVFSGVDKESNLSGVFAIIFILFLLGLYGSFICYMRSKGYSTIHAVGLGMLGPLGYIIGFVLKDKCVED